MIIRKSTPELLKSYEDVIEDLRGELGSLSSIDQSVTKALIGDEAMESVCKARSDIYTAIDVLEKAHHAVAELLEEYNSTEVKP